VREREREKERERERERERFQPVTHSLPQSCCLETLSQISVMVNIIVSSPAHMKLSGFVLDYA
jgi:hypothetical protein